MKKYLLLALIFLMSCSTTTKQLNESKTCNVWEEQKVFGPQAVEVVDNTAKWKGKCALFFVFWCEWIHSDMPANQTTIYMDSNGMINSRKAVAKVSGDSFTYEPNFLDGIVKNEPVLIDKKNRQVTRTVDVKLVDFKSQSSLSFNESCTSSQVALGAVTLWASQNRH